MDKEAGVFRTPTRVLRVVSAPPALGAGDDVPDLKGLRSAVRFMQGTFRRLRWRRLFSQLVNNRDNHDWHATAARPPRHRHRHTTTTRPLRERHANAAATATGATAASLSIALTGGVHAGHGAVTVDVERASTLVC